MKSDIKIDNICLSCIPLISDNSYFSITNILTEFKKDKLHIIETCDIIARENKYIPFSYKFCISANNSNKVRDKKEFTTKEKFSLETQGYIPINKKIKFDNINFSLISLGNFNCGSLFTILTENIDKEKCKEICQQYSIKLKSKNFQEIYSLEDRNSFTDIAIKKFSKLDKRYDANSKFDQFYISKMFYNINDVDRNNMQIYLVNNISNEEIQIF